MPWRLTPREQPWLLPPSVSDLLPDDHPVRLILDFLDLLPDTTWAKLGIPQQPDPRGAPAYPPQVLLAVWLYGFMTGTRSSRKLETACREQLPFRWLTGGATPDHNTLWRFYQTHRPDCRELLRQTVRMAVRVGCVDWAVQAVDGTKIQGSAAKAKSYDAAELEALIGRADQAIATLEAQNTGGDDPAPGHLPAALADANVRRARLQAALTEATTTGHAVNLTDPDARLMKGRQGTVAGYNAQAMVAPIAADHGGGMLITGALVTQDANDQHQLVPMLAEAQALTEALPAVTAADAGYLSGPNLAACAAAGLTVVIPDGHRYPADPYHKHRFAYDAATDSYRCPEGQQLRYSHRKHKRGEAPMLIYQAPAAACRECPAFGRCTTNRHGRRIERGLEEQQRDAHHGWMQTATAKALYRLRKQLVEPVFGLLKEHHGARRFLLRGLANVGHEWTLLATGFNLKMLWRVLRNRGWSLGSLGHAA